MLLITTILLSIVLLPLGILFTIFEIIRKRSLKKAMWYASNTVRIIAVSIDQLGNVVCRDLFNRCLITSEWYKFWYQDETISSVLGKNERDNTLTNTGEMIVAVLDMVDEGHCERSIEEF